MDSEWEMASPTRDGHIAAERLAALADEAPTAGEEQHLSACPACRDEVLAYQNLLALTRAERDQLAEPLTSWEVLAAALAREAGRPETPVERPARRTPTRPIQPWIPPWARGAAAATVLLGSGIAIGRVTAPSPRADAAGSQAGIATAPPTSIASAASSGAIPAAYRAQPGGDTSLFRTRDDALRALSVAEDQYRHAVAYLMVQDTGFVEGTDAFRTRLRALDEVAHTTREALLQAPNDPVLNQWYISTVGARRATLRELGRALLPDSVSLRGF